MHLQRSACGESPRDPHLGGHGSAQLGPGAAPLRPPTPRILSRRYSGPRRSTGQLFRGVGPTSSSASRSRNQINASPVASSRSSSTGELCQTQGQRTSSLVPPTPPALADGSSWPIRNAFSTVSTTAPPTGLQPAAGPPPETAGMGHSNPRTVAPRETLVPQIECLLPV